MPPKKGPNQAGVTPSMPAQSDDVKYQSKYKELKVKLAEIEEVRLLCDNTKLSLKVLKSKKAIQRLRIERAILYDRLQTSAQPTNPFTLHTVSAAERYGRRAVLFASLFGNAITLVAFGMCWDLKSAVMIRFAQGVFNGAVGVARSAVQDLTDETNKASAFTLVGLCWGLGGIVGSIIGGTTEHPTTNFPTIFRYASLFARYPYLLPCLLAASITFTGSILSLFLASNGGPRLPSYPLQTEAERLVGFALDSPLHTPVSERTPLVGKRASTRYASDSLAFRRFESLRSQNASIVTSTRYAPDFENFADLSFGQK
ncbi:hypothetical protein MNV49_003754 [Pseudohyphozyma bogoriensis]|nr:hypothetical protein MNV49_003754 [Pseudohyphozyma bogoriensis]